MATREMAARDDESWMTDICPPATFLDVVTVDNYLPVIKKNMYNFTALNFTFSRIYLQNSVHLSHGSSFRMNGMMGMNNQSLSALASTLGVPHGSTI